MSEIEPLLRSSRPCLIPRDEHRARLRDSLQYRHVENAPSWLSSRPDYAVLVLSVSAATICLFTSMLLATSLPISQIGTSRVNDEMPTTHISHVKSMGLISYVRTIIPRPEYGHPAALRAALLVSGQ